MKNLCLILATQLLFVGCYTTNKSEKNSSISSQNENCIIVPDKLFKGQIAYFDGMNLHLPSCAKIIREIRFSSRDESQKIYLELNLNDAEPESEILYVNIEFYGSTLPDGTTIIHSVKNAKLTEEYIYDYGPLEP